MKKTAISFARRFTLGRGVSRSIATLVLVAAAGGIGSVRAQPAPQPPSSAAAAQPSSRPAASAQAAVHPPLPYQMTDKSMGVVNCANSLCHGSVQPFKDSNVLQNEYVTWSRVDKHARAYKVLFNDQSARIARNLGLGKASEAKICIDCHAHNVSNAQRGDRFKFDDGVSCEACHGPSERWLPKHVEDGAKHSGNLEAGLFPTDDPSERARLCLSCHFGNADRFVTHRMMGAGHPRLSFELETFTAVEPAHFKNDSDWEKRKRVWDGVKVWAIGQSLAVSEMMDLLADPKRGRDGLFPELVLFDCHACHHPMSDKRWVPRIAGLGPGVVRLNDSSMLMVRAIADVIDRPLGDRIASRMNHLQQTVTGGGDAIGTARALKADVAQLTATLDQRTLTEADMRGILAALVDEGLNGQFRDYAGAEQATMAIGSVTNFMFQKGILKSARDINGGLANLQAAVANDERFSPGQFETALRNFRGSVGR
ncbi:MAG: cytochrome c family protein [Pseudomonadota bacterium]|nr:cytochrome c family protein [Pseudomonadota bacterium]